MKVHATGVIQTPHDPDAQWSAKGHGAQKKSWVGYKVQVAESLGEKTETEAANFITSMLTQKASQSDDPGLEESLCEQARSGLEPPTELYVDGAYISAARIREASQQGCELIGPAQPSGNRTGRADAYRIEAFEVNIARRKARCPGGFQSTQCSRINETGRKVVYRFEWSYHCQGCPLRADCVPTSQRHRTIVVGQDHDLLQQRRREQLTPEFRQRMHQRNAIEGTLSELVRAHGLRRSRYRGFAKVELQNFFIAAACNIKRWLRLIATLTVTLQLLLDAVLDRLAGLRMVLLLEAP